MLAVAETTFEYIRGLSLSLVRSSLSKIFGIISIAEDNDLFSQTNCPIGSIESNIFF